MICGSLATAPGPPFLASKNDIRGSHCGAGAPRFNIVTNEDPGDIFFLRLQLAATGRQ